MYVNLFSTRVGGGVSKYRLYLKFNKIMNGIKKCTLSRKNFSDSCYTNSNFDNVWSAALWISFQPLSAVLTRYSLLNFKPIHVYSIYRYIEVLFDYMPRPLDEYHSIYQNIFIFTWNIFLSIQINIYKYTCKSHTCIHT